MKAEKLKKTVVHIINKIQKRSKMPRVLTIEETIERIIEEKLSVARYGDGEIRWMFNISHDSFQEVDDELGKRLKQVMSVRDDKLLICINDIFGDLEQYDDATMFFWEKHNIRYKRLWKKVLDKNYIYGNTNITRPYISYRNKKEHADSFNLIKKVWQGKKVGIVEGRYTRFGIGNDLLCGCEEVNRILCPEKNAFLKYKEIINSISEHFDKDTIILLALGPTATVMVPELNEMGYQAIDVGHLDVEYEWYLESATEKVPVKGKYVNEAGGINTLCKNDLALEEYYKQIVEEIHF